MPTLEEELVRVRRELDVAHAQIRGLRSTIGQIKVEHAARLEREQAHVMRLSEQLDNCIEGGGYA